MRISGTKFNNITDVDMKKLVLNAFNSLMEEGDKLVVKRTAGITKVFWATM